jgi:hypothetical protein
MCAHGESAASPLRKPDIGAKSEDAMGTYTARVVCKECKRELVRKRGVLAQDCARLSQETPYRFACDGNGGAIMLPKGAHYYNTSVQTLFDAEDDDRDGPVAGWDAAPVPVPDAAPAPERQAKHLDPDDPNNELDASVPGGVRRKANGVAGHAAPAETEPVPPEPAPAPPERGPFDSSAKPS